jgi:hypothetical protein
MKIVALVGIVLGAAFLGACSSTSEQFIPRPDVESELASPDEARIFLFRKGQPFGSNNELLVWDGDVVVGTLTMDHYLSWDRLAGMARIKMVLDRPGMQNLQGISAMDVEPGKTYYWMVEHQDINRRPKIVNLTEQIGPELLANREPAPMATSR